MAEDPITIKGGGSVDIEFEDTFGDIISTDPKKKKKFKHKGGDAIYVTKLIIVRHGTTADKAIDLNHDDHIKICYTGSECPDKA